MKGEEEMEGREPTKVEDSGRVRLTDVNPHLVCVLCHGYFVDATTITECLHSFCRSCIFRHLETKSFCPICEVQVHARLHRSLKSDKTLQDIVYKLVPGLFHSEMERRRRFYKLYPHRDEHLEPERRGLGLDRLIYSPSDTISLSLEFYDTEREKEEWSAVTCPTSQHQENYSANINNNNKRYLQCPAVFKMAHLKKFIRQKYNLSSTSNVEIIYKRESLPDSYSLMDVAYIYTWKRNGPMRFYYKIPDVVEMVEQSKTLEGEPSLGITEEKKEEKIEEVSISVKVKEEVISAEKIKNHGKEKVRSEEKKAEVHKKKSREGAEEKIQSPRCTEKSRENRNGNTIEKLVIKLNQSEPSLSNVATVSQKNEMNLNKEANKPLPGHIEEKQKEMNKNKGIIESKKEDVLKDTNGIEVPKQDELPVSVLLSLGKYRLGKEGTPTQDSNPHTNKVLKGSEGKGKATSNGRVSVNKIASDLQQKAVGGLQKASKENLVSQGNTPRHKPQYYNYSGSVTLGKHAGGKPKKNNSPQQHSSYSHNSHKGHNGDMSVMDHRIQQLYRNQGNSAATKPESRLANWLNNRFQTKPPSQGSPVKSNTLGDLITSSLVGPSQDSPSEPARTTESDPSSPANTSVQSSDTSTPVNSDAPTIKNCAMSINPNKGNRVQTSHTSSQKKNAGNGIKENFRNGNVSVNSAGNSPNNLYSFVNNTSVCPPSRHNGLSETSKVIEKSLNGINSPAHVPDYQNYKNEIPVPASMKTNPSVDSKSSTTNFVNSPNNLSPSQTINGSTTPIYKNNCTINKQRTPILNGSNLRGTMTKTVSGEAKKGVEGNTNSKLNEEVSKLKRKLEELKRTHDAKGREVGGCLITQENPDPEEAKKRRDLTPVVSIELMRGGKRPVPGLKAIQEIVELGKRKGEDCGGGEKKQKLSLRKEEVLDLSRFGPPGSPAHRPAGISSPAHRPAGLSSPAHRPSGLSSPAHLPAGLSSPAHRPSGLSSPAHRPSGLSSPAHRPSGLSSPAHRPAGLSSPAHRPAGLSSPAHRPAGMASPAHSPALSHWYNPLIRLHYLPSSK